MSGRPRRLAYRLSLAALIAVLCVAGATSDTLAANTSLAGKWSAPDGTVFDFVASGTDAFSGQIVVNGGGYCLPIDASLTGANGKYTGTVDYYTLPCDTTEPGGAASPEGRGPLTVTIAANGETANYAYGPYPAGAECPTGCGTIALTRMAAMSQPVLGAASFDSPSARGFGTVEPRTVFLGGDPTGQFKDLSWKMWGMPKATGHGTGFYDPPGKPTADSVKAKVTLVASSLGQCQGALAYQRLAVSFVYHGHNHSGRKLSICA
ncbi:MAG: hypothetical protein ACLP0J_22005 [Solirubrobacteraceae bacterium]